MSSGSRFNEDVFSLTAFLAGSARSGLDEGVFAATYRLVDTISRLLELFPELLEDEFFSELNILLKENMTTAYLLSEEEYTEFLDDLLRRFATEVCKRNGIDVQT